MLRLMLAESARLAGLLGRRGTPRNPLLQPTSYRPCPCCDALMHRRNFGQSSGVIIDTCSLHGTWFDAGELPAVLRFTESGELLRSEQRSAAKPHVPLTVAGAPTSVAVDVGLGEAMVELLLYLLSEYR